MRRGVTREDVVAAIRSLEAEGRPVSLKTVRAQLGTGSNTTLLKHLRHVSTVAAKHRHSPVPAQLQAAQDVVLRQVWAVARNLGDAEGAAVLKQELASLASERSSLQSQLNQLKKEAAELFRRVQQAEHALARHGKYVEQLLSVNQCGQVRKVDTVS